MSQYDKATDEDMAGLESRMTGGYYQPEVEILESKGYRVRFNVQTKSGDLMGAGDKWLMGVDETQMKLLRDAGEAQRETVIKGLLAAHQRHMEALRAMQQRERR